MHCTANSANLIAVLMAFFKIKTKKCPAMMSGMVHITYSAMKDIGSVSGYLKTIARLKKLLNRKSGVFRCLAGKLLH